MTNENKMTTTTQVKLSDPLTLPCGAILPNRLAKAALTEHLATPDGQVTPELERLYGLWSQGGCGLLISGNIQVDMDHVELAGNVILHGGHAQDEAELEALKKWTVAATAGGNHFWAQLSHAGRQTQVDVNPTPKAPSAVQLGLPGGKFGVPQAMTIPEIQETIQAFAQAAKTCQLAGFTGVQLHAAHGYLLSSFLNPRANQRTDEYGGSLEHRARILLDTVTQTRALVGPKFPIAVKLNSADFQKGGFQFTDSLQVVQWLEEAGVDLIEISGGNYEQGAMMNLGGLEEKEEQQVQNNNKAPSTIAREAYFLEFAMAMQSVVKVPLMVTGGFRTRAAMDYALESGGADVIGLGRPLCVMTNGAQQLLDGTLDELPRYEDDLDLLPAALCFLKRFQIINMVSGFSNVFWFYEQLISLAQTGKPLDNLGTFSALIAMDRRTAKLLAGRTKGLTANHDSSNGVVVMGVALVGIVAAVGAGHLMKATKK